MTDRLTDTRLSHFATHDPDELVERIAPVAAGVASEEIDGGPYGASVTAARLPRLGIFCLHVDNARFESSNARDYISLTLPIRGCIDIKSGRRSVEYKPGSGHYLDSEEVFDIATVCASTVLVANFQREVVERYAEGDGIAGAVCSPDLSMSSPAGASLGRQLGLVWSELNRGGALLTSARVAEESEDLLAALLASAVAEPENQVRTPDIGTTAVTRAIGYIHEHLTDVVTLADLAAEAGVSPRSLHRGFKRHIGTAPLRYLRDRRLDAAQRSLLAADPDAATVAECAKQLGFFHLGRFASAYRSAFGELPSETLRRVPGRRA